MSGARGATQKRRLRAEAVHEYRVLRSDVHAALFKLRTDIDRLGDMAAGITRDEDCDMKGCFASNLLHGADALLREMDALVASHAPRKAR